MSVFSENLVFRIGPPTLGAAGSVRIADAVEEGKTVAVGGVVIRVLTSSAAVVVEGVVKLESGFKLACYGLVASDAELPADLVECVGFGFVWW